MSPAYENARRWLREHDVQKLTWGDVDKFIRENGYDDEEYFEAHTIFRHQNARWQEKPVFDKNIRWIAVYWVVGTSEGYYVHVETRECETQKAELVLLGKFWDQAHAEEVSNALQALVNVVA